VTVRRRAAATAVVASSSLVAGYAAAATTGVRPVGGAVLIVGAAWCARRWGRDHGWPTAAALTGVGVVAFAVAHPLGQRIGAWPAVLGVAAVAGSIAYAATGLRSDSAEDPRTPIARG
jgi:hypothetical protein